jgi:tetratricopeptide (TPR) repeat protein
VEGVRRDIKIINFMYLESDWYYTQMMSRTYEAAPLLTTATVEQVTGESKLPTVIREIRPSLNIKQALQLFYSGKTVRKYPSGQEVAEFPTKELVLPVNTAKFVEAGLIEDTSAMVPNINFKLSGSMMTRAKLGALDFAANNFNDRPIYYGGRDNEFLMGTLNFLRDEGVAKRMLPENTQKIPVNIDKTFDLLMNKYRFRGLNDPNIFIDETSRQQMIPHYRNAFFSLAESLKANGDKHRLKQLMEKYREVLPEMERLVSSALYSIYIFSCNPVVDNYFYSDLTEYGTSLSKRLMDEYKKEIEYYIQLHRKFGAIPTIKENMYYSYHGLNGLLTILKKYNQEDLQKEVEELLKGIRGVMDVPM